MKKASITVTSLSAFIMLSCLAPAVAHADKIEVLWTGHATVRITSVEGKVIVVDPSLRKNPATPEKYRKLESLGKVDLILVTHGHGDHTADLSELAKLTGAKVVSNRELGLQMVALGKLESTNAITMNKGGTVTPIGPKIKIHMVSADHSSSIDLGELTGGVAKFVDGGAPVGYIIELENGFKIYHSGDTGVFGDMALIGKLYKPDLAMVCIGGVFTMDSEGAAYAMSELVKPKQVIPIHYGTYPFLTGTPAQLKKALGSSKIKVIDLKPGESVTF